MYKIQLTIGINFISSIGNDEERVMHSKSDNKEITINNEADEVIKMIFKSLKNTYQNNQGSMRGSDFVFDYVHLLYYKYHKINPNRCRSFIDSLDWRKNKKATINPINKKYNKCFQYAVTVALNHEEVRKNPERITKIKTFINKYNQEGLNFPSQKDDSKKIEKNNRTIAPNVLHAKQKYILLKFQNITQIVKNKLFF